MKGINAVGYVLSATSYELSLGGLALPNVLMEFDLFERYKSPDKKAELVVR